MKRTGVKEIRECRVHGQTEFSGCVRKGRTSLQWHCMKCSAEQVTKYRSTERGQEITQAYTAANRTKLNAASKRHYIENRDYYLSWSKESNIALKKEVIAAYGGACKCCDEDIFEFLTIDHVDGGGRKHRQELGMTLYKWLKKNGFPQEGFRLLCIDCNFSLGKYGYCPHERARALTMIC
jgi:hypothetical protein